MSITETCVANDDCLWSLIYHRHEQQQYSWIIPTDCRSCYQAVSSTMLSLGCRSVSRPRMVVPTENFNNHGIDRMRQQEEKGW